LVIIKRQVRSLLKPVSPQRTQRTQRELLGKYSVASVTSVVNRLFQQPVGRAVALVTVMGTVLGSVSCGEVLRHGRSPSIMVIHLLQAASGAQPEAFSNVLQSDVVTLVSATVNGQEVLVPTIYEDMGRAALYMVLKDQGSPTNAAAPSVLNRMKINRYRVVYRRADGRNTPGVDVPYPFDGAITATISQSTTEVIFSLVRIQAKIEPPLRALATGGAIAISTIADITFYGEDLAGNAFEVTGSISINFANWGDPA